MAANLYALFRSRFGEALDRSFLRLPDGRVVTYGDMDRLCGQQATVLRDAGAAAGERVVAQVQKCPAAIALYLACLRLGAVYVPVNPAYTSRELEHVLGDAAPKIFVCKPSSAAELASIAKREGVERVFTLSPQEDGSLDLAAANSQSFEGAVPRVAHDLAALLYTSGTTGDPKGAMLSIRNLASNALALNALWGFRGDDVLVHALPVFHEHGLFVALHCAMLSASQVLFLPRFDVEAVRAALREATVIMGVPTFYTRLLACPDFGRESCTRMRLFVSGSAPLLEATFSEFERRTGHRILERYGMTETGMIASNPLDGERVAGTVGFALPEVALRVSDESGAAVPAGTPGSVEVRGPNVFAGYWGRREQTKRAFLSDGFFVTGDLGRLTEDGRLTLVGRASDLIISGGYNIYPKEVESCLDAMPEIAESAVIGVPHPDLGEGVVAIVVPARPGAFDESAVRTALTAGLARYKHPRRLFVVDLLPRNTMGKVQKPVLRERYANALTDTHSTDRER